MGTPLVRGLLLFGFFLPCRPKNDVPTLFSILQLNPLNQPRAMPAVLPQPCTNTFEGAMPYWRQKSSSSGQCRVIACRLRL